MSMKFDIKKLQEVRIQLEAEMKEIKKVLTQKHDINTAPQLQARKVGLKERLTFLYSAIAYTRDKVHIHGLWPNEQADWILAQIAKAKKNESLTKYPWGQHLDFALRFFKVPEIVEKQETLKDEELPF